MVSYLLSWGHPAERLFEIAIRFTAPTHNPRLLLPAWRPGRYLIQDYAANVREWTAGEHPIEKDGKSSWRVDAREGEEVVVRYRYYAGVLDAGSSFLDEDEAYWNGSNLLMLVEGLRQEEHLLTVAAPAEWRIEIQLPREGDLFRARDYDHLIDSPGIAAASMTRHTFDESGARIHLVFRGDEGIETDVFVEPVRAIVRSQAAMFGGLPFQEYRFLYHVGDKWHGVEHEDSSSILARRSALLAAGPGEDGYDRLLGITSHELFHTWNVKRIVPARFRPYDYWSETPTRLLWVMEGLTSYYAELTLVRSGLWTAERYLQHLGREIETLESSPARTHLSLSQASFDAWLSSPAQRHDHPNAWYSFYNKGEVVSALLELTIRRSTEGARSLDDVMLALWRDYGMSGRGLEEDGFERAVAAVADTGDFFARYVDGTDPLPYDDVLGWAGIGYAASSRPGASLGARVNQREGVLIAEAVLRGGAGLEAGLLHGDELVSLDGMRTSSEDALGAALRGLQIGDRAELVISRDGVVRRLSLQGKPDPRPTIALRPEGRSEARRHWLRSGE